jgi:hypothetical protein
MNECYEHLGPLLGGGREKLKRKFAKNDESLNFATNRLQKALFCRQWLSVVHLKRTGMYIYPYEIV